MFFDICFKRVTKLKYHKLFQFFYFMFMLFVIFTYFLENLIENINEFDIQQCFKPKTKCLLYWNAENMHQNIKNTIFHCSENFIMSIFKFGSRPSSRLKFLRLKMNLLLNYSEVDAIIKYTVFFVKYCF